MQLSLEQLQADAKANDKLRAGEMLQFMCAVRGDAESWTGMQKLLKQFLDG